MNAKKFNILTEQAKGNFALMLKTPVKAERVKAMVIIREEDEKGRPEFSFSGERKFDSVQKLVAFTGI